MTARPERAATTPTEIQEAWFEGTVGLTDAQLLVLVLGMGTTRHGRGVVKKTWTAIALAEELLAAAGGRLEHLVACARRDDFDLRRFGLGKVLGSRLVAAMELAHRWRRGFRRGGNPRIQTDAGDDLKQRILLRRVPLTEGELVAVLLARSWVWQKKAGSFLTVYPNLETLIEKLTPAVYLARRRAGTWSRSEPVFDVESSCRVLAAIELARRHRARAGFEHRALSPGSFGLSSPYLVKLLNPASPLDRPTRQRLLANARSNPRMAADFTRLERLANDAGTDDYLRAIQHHWMFEALLEDREWSHPAEVLGEPVPFAPLLSIAANRIGRAGRRPAGILRVQELLAAAELAAARRPLTAFVAALVELELSESGVERACVEVRRRFSSSVTG